MAVASLAMIGWIIRRQVRKATVMVAMMIQQGMRRMRETGRVRISGVPRAKSYVVEVPAPPPPCVGKLDFY
jgi:hypothetical protein